MSGGGERGRKTRLDLKHPGIVVRYTPSLTATRDGYGKGGERLGVPEKKKLYLLTAQQAKDMLMLNVYWQQKGVLETKRGTVKEWAAQRASAPCLQLVAKRGTRWSSFCCRTGASEDGAGGGGKTC